MQIQPINPFPLTQQYTPSSRSAKPVFFAKKDVGNYRKPTTFSTKVVTGLVALTGLLMASVSNVSAYQQKSVSEPVAIEQQVDVTDDKLMRQRLLSLLTDPYDVLKSVIKNETPQI